MHFHMTYYWIWFLHISFSWSTLTLSTNSEGQVQMLSQPWYLCPPEPSILLWSLKTIYKNLWVTKFLVCFWSRPFGVALIWFWIKLKQLELLSTSAVTQNWKKDGLKTVDAKQTDRQTEPITHSLHSEKKDHYRKCWVIFVNVIDEGNLKTKHAFPLTARAA